MVNGQEAKYPAEANYPINLTQSNRRFESSLQYNRSDNFLSVDATKIYQFKAKDSEIKNYLLCLDNTWKDFKINNTKKVGLKGSVNYFLLIIDLLTLMKFQVSTNT